MNKNEIITLILVFLIAGSSIAYMMYSEDIGKAWYKGKRTAKLPARAEPPSSPVTELYYPPCQPADSDCVKARALFQLIPLKTDSGIFIQGVFDKERKFSLHQFGVVYDALTTLPNELKSALKLLVFSPHPSLGSGAVSDQDTGTIYFGYKPEGYMQSDKALFCTTIHEAGHLIETNSNVLKSFRNICFDFANRAWQKKPECQASDFAPQLSEDGKNWNNELRIRSAGGDGREDIANAIEYYVCAGNLFRAEARARPKMKEKYLSLKELFNGKEYQCEVDGCLTLVPTSTPCGNNGCTSCRNINDPCTTACNDCPKLAGCRPGMDCKTCNPKHPDCKYWTCKNSVCGINQW